MLLPDLSIEKILWGKGYEFIAGVDEVGRGAWAGPLVVAAVVLPQDFKIPKGLADSKLLKPQQRLGLSKVIYQKAVSTSIAKIEVARINRIKIGRATHEAFRKVVKNLSIVPDFCLIDAFYIKHFSKKHQKAVPNGDKICASIAAASIIAKVYRDNMMKKLNSKYPKYGFAKHKGYGTKFHQEAIKQFGFTKIHRTSFNLSYLIS